MKTFILFIIYLFSVIGSSFGQEVIKPQSDDVFVIDSVFKVSKIRAFEALNCGKVIYMDYDSSPYKCVVTIENSITKNHKFITIGYDSEYVELNIRPGDWVCVNIYSGW